MGIELLIGNDLLDNVIQMSKTLKNEGDITIALKKMKKRNAIKKDMNLKGWRHESPYYLSILDNRRHSFLRCECF